MGAGKGRTCRGQKEAQAIKNSHKNKVRARAVSEPAALGTVGSCLCCAGLTKCEYPNVNIQIWPPVGGADLSQAPAVGSSSHPVPGHWAWDGAGRGRMFLPCAGRASLSRDVVPMWQELVHPCEERNRESLWEQQCFIQRHPPALCNGEISRHPRELDEGQANPQEKLHQIHHGGSCHFLLPQHHLPLCLPSLVLCLCG